MLRITMENHEYGNQTHRFAGLRARAVKLIQRHVRIDQPFQAATPARVGGGHRRM